MAISLRAELVKRIVREAAVVEAKFPGRFRLTEARHGPAAWIGAVPVEGRDVPVQVTYPVAYPGVPPILEALTALPPGCPHVLERGPSGATLCWIAPGARAAGRRWQPHRHTAATVLGAAQRWFLAFFVWQTLGFWPVPDVIEVEGWNRS